MDALLGQLGIGGASGGDPARSNSGCNSVDELQRQLHNVVATKKTETRAEHISASFEMRISSVFHIADDLDAGTAEAFEQLQNTSTRTVNASDAVLNQSTDDPELQKSVAKHLVGALQVVDGSTWDLRQAHRSAQGWNFTYQCEHSMQAWKRRNAKSSERPPIGAFSGVGGLDHVNLSRPAFDCRGTLTIIFSKSNREIVVKYEHTPLHKTVAELVDRLLPTLPLPPPPNAKGSTPSAIRSTKAKRPPPPGGEANGRGKQKKKADKAAGTNDIENGAHSRVYTEAHTEAHPEAHSASHSDVYPEALPEAHSEVHSGVYPEAHPEAHPEAYSEARPGAYPEAHPEVHSEAPPEAHPEAPSKVSAATPTHSKAVPVLQIPPQEAARRKGVAVRLLTSRGIRPEALSAEQMDIFCNQAPHLQALSLDMLAEYGPERLRIIHPEAKDPAGSSSSTPIQQPSPIDGLANASAPAVGISTTKITSPDEPEVVIMGGKAISNENIYTFNTESAPVILASQLSRRRKTRGTCNTCKLAKRKCTKEHPQCSVCKERGETCIYLDSVPRGSRRSEISAAAVQGLELDNTSEAVEYMSHAPPALGQTTQMMEAAPRVPDYDGDEYIPDPNILADPKDQPPALLSQSRGSPHCQQSNAANVPLPDPFISSPVPQSHNSVIRRQIMSSNDRASASTLQVAQPGKHIANTAVQRQSTPNWASSPYTPALAERGSAGSALIHKSYPAKKSRSRLSDTGSSTPPFGSVQAAAVLSQAPIPASYQQNLTDINRLPNQSRTLDHNNRNTTPKPRSREKFGQGHKSQSQVTVTRTSSAPSGISATHNATWKPPFHTQASPSNAASGPSHDPFTRYNTTGNNNYSQSSSDQSPRIGYTHHPYEQMTTQAVSNSYTTTQYDHSRGDFSNSPFAHAFNETSGYDNTFESNEEWASHNRSSTSHNPS